MQMAAKVIKLDISYSCETSHAYRQQKHYISPWPNETAEHFARRILAFICLYELQPHLSPEDCFGKFPDIYIEDAQHHLQLWCQLHLMPQKKMLRASHLADQVLLVLDELETDKILNLSSDRAHIFTLQALQLAAFCHMLKPSMKLNVWRDDLTLFITDGEQLLQLTLPELETLLH